MGTDMVVVILEAPGIVPVAVNGGWGGGDFIESLVLGVNCQQVVHSALTGDADTFQRHSSPWGLTDEQVACAEPIN